jgi:hypothetical protein
MIVIPSNDKAEIRNNILQALLHTNNHLILKQLNQCVKKILKYDFEKNWEGFTPTVINFFNSGEDKGIYTGIIAFHQLSKLYEFETGEYKKNYNIAFDAAHPFFLAFLDNLVPKLQNDHAALLCNKILKIFFKSIQLDISKTITDKTNFNTWITYMLKIINYEGVNQEKTENPDEREKLAKLVQWKLIALAFQTTYRIYQKYGYLQGLDNKNVPMKEFCTLIQNNYSEMLLNVYIQTLYKSNDKYIPDKIIFYVFKYMSQCISRKHNMTIIEAHLDTIIREYIIQNSFISVKDVGLFDEDPKNYISRQFDIIEHYYVLRYTICQFIKSICDYRNKEKQLVYFEYVYKYLVSILEIYETQISQGVVVDSRIKEAVLYIMQSISADILK